MQWREEFRHILSKQFVQRKQRNHRYSVRAFAKQSGVSSGTMSELLNGKGDWNLSKARAIEILGQLKVNPTSVTRVRVLMGEKIPMEIRQIEPSSYGLLTDATYQAVLFGLDLPASATSLESLRRRLRLDPDTMNRIVSQLLANGLIEPNGLGSYARKKTVIMATEGIPKPVLRQHHIDNLSRAGEALEKFPSEARDITTMTLAGSRQRLEVVRREIREFYERLIHLMADDVPSDEVYRVSVGIFPLTSPEENPLAAKDSLT